MLAQKLMSVVSSGGNAELVSSGTHGGTLNVPSPTTYSSGDQLFIFMGADNDSSIAPMTAPAGFTELDGRTNPVSYVWTKTLGGSEPVEYTFTTNNGVTNLCGFLYIVVSGMSGYVAGSISSTRIASSITMPQAGKLFYFIFDVEGSLFTAPDGMTLVRRALFSQPEDGTILCAVEDVLSGDTDTRNVTGDTNNPCAVLLGVY